MNRVAAGLLVTLIAHAGLAGEDRGRKDVPYSETGAERNRLDVYAPADGEKHPVVVWVHGGAWQMGDKSHVQLKPRALNDAGYVFVSVGYRLHPEADYKTQAGDIAGAVRWVRDHAGEFGGDPGRIFLMGHSAGAHLAALVATDGRYLEAAGLKLSDLSGVVLLDGAGYNIPRQVARAPLPRMKAMYTNVFTRDQTTQEDASPTRHVGPGKGTPPFLILHVARRPDSKAQSEGLAALLRGAGVEATVVPAEGKTHATINRELGAPGDAPTAAVLDFLRTRAAGLKKGSNARTPGGAGETP